LYIDINGVGSEYSGVSTTGIELLDYTLNQSEIVFLNSPPNLSIILSSAINQTPVLKVKDKSNNSLVNGTNVKYSIVDDTSGAFAADAGLSINADTGVISGTPATGKSIKTGTFKVKATPVASTD
jgi:hypothetical protein